MRTKFVNLSVSADLWSHIYGIASLLGLSLTVYFSYLTYHELVKPGYEVAIYMLGISLNVVLISFFLLNGYYLRRIKYNKETIANHSIVMKDLKRQRIISKYQSECFHNITHYYRNTIASLDRSESKINELSKEDINEVIRRADFFFILLTTSVQNYFSIVTDDNCSVTIKLLDKDPMFVNAFFRDPLSFNKRRRDRHEGNKIPIDANTSMKIIMDPRLKDIHFSCDNLEEQKKLYENSNGSWKEYYNAILTVPITMVIDREDRVILGFLSVDNMTGGLDTNENKEFLFAISDLLYNLFEKYRFFIKIVGDDITENERAKIARMGC